MLLLSKMAQPRAKSSLPPGGRRSPNPGRYAGVDCKIGEGRPIPGVHSLCSSILCRPGYQMGYAAVPWYGTQTSRLQEGAGKFPRAERASMPCCPEIGWPKRRDDKFPRMEQSFYVLLP